MSFLETWLEIFLSLLFEEAVRQKYVAAGFAVLTAFELVLPAERGQGWSGRLRNVLFLAIYFGLGLAAAAVWLAVTPPWESGRETGWSAIAVRVLLYLLVFDFLYYWYHRAQHRFPVLWAIHELHHADAEVNVTTSYRTYWLEAPVQLLLVFMPALLILGPFGLAAGVTLLVASRFFLLFTHANLRLSLGPLAPILCGPQVHRIHHSRLPHHLDRNFAQIFPFYDVLFGTYHAPRRGEYPVTGTPGLASDAPLLEVMLRPFALWRDQVRRLGGRDAAPSRR